MAIGDIAHWRDSAGSQIPGTSWGGMNFATQIRNDNSNYSMAGNAITLSEAGAGNAFLFIANIRTRDTSNGRFNMQAQFEVNSGTGTIWSTHCTGYSRDNSEDDAFVRAIAIYHGGAANDSVKIEWRRDTDAPTGGSVINESDVQVVRIDFQAIGMYNDTGSGSAYGGTTPNLVTLNNNILQTDGAVISRTGSAVSLAQTNTRYLVIWCVAGQTGGSRTQRIGHLEVDGTDQLDTRSYFYQRNASNEYGGLGAMTLIDVAGTAKTVEIEVYRGDGVAADQGGADVDGSWVHSANMAGMCVVALPDTVEVFKSYDSTGLQDVTSTTKYSMNVMWDVDFNDSASFTKASNTAMNIEKDMDLLCYSSIWTARNNVSVNARLTAWFNVEIGGTDQTVGVHGNYSRGNQGSQDTFGCSFHPGGIFSVSQNDDIVIEGIRISGGEAGGTDRTQANTAGFIAINLDTFEAAAPAGRRQVVIFS